MENWRLQSALVLHIGPPFVRGSSVQQPSVVPVESSPLCLMLGDRILWVSLSMVNGGGLLKKRASEHHVAAPNARWKQPWPALPLPEMPLPRCAIGSMSGASPSVRGQPLPTASFSPALGWLDAPSARRTLRAEDDQTASGSLFPVGNSLGGVALGKEPHPAWDISHRRA